MDLSKRRKELAPLWTAAALFLCLALPVKAAGTIAPETVPEETASLETIPEETIPEETLPEETLPEETFPEETLPEETLPEETIPEETTPEETTPEETIPEETAPEELPCTLWTVAQCLEEVPGSGGLCTQGTVVWANGRLAVLQDDTGGILLLFDTSPGTCPGERLQVLGRRCDSGLSVESFVSLGSGALPALETSLEEAPEAVRIRTTGRLEEGLLSQGSRELSADTAACAAPVPRGRVSATGVILDGVFYADSLTALPEEEAQTPQSSWRTCFGLLHGHTGLTGDGAGPEDAFAYAAGVENLDFYALTNFSDSFQEDDWEAGTAAARAVTDDGFVGIFGYERYFPETERIGHIGVLATDRILAWEPGDGIGLPEFWQQLYASPEAIGQFNHPYRMDSLYGNFAAYSPEADQTMYLLELDLASGDLSHYNKALKKGWHLAPSAAQPDTPGQWGDVSPVRTAVLAEALDRESVFEAIRSLRVYATQDSDLSVEFTLHGAPMGGSAPRPGEDTDPLTGTVTLCDPTDSGKTRVQVFLDGIAWSQDYELEATGQLTFRVPASANFYYLVITQADGDTAVTAPVWLEDYDDVGIRSLQCTPSAPEAGEEVRLELTFFNNEQVDYRISKIELMTLGGSEPFFEQAPELTVSPGRPYPHTLTFPWPEGSAPVYVQITGTAGGQEQNRKAALEVEYRLALTDIAQVRRLPRQELYRVRGYVTADNDNAYNSFPDTIYIQDDTGGIAVTNFSYDPKDPGTQVSCGTRLEVTGILREDALGNLSLEQVDVVRTDDRSWCVDPGTIPNREATDYALHGGEFLQIQGKVVSVVKTSDRKGILRLTLRDSRGDLATAVIPAGIGSSTYGTNTLAGQIVQGRTVRVRGLCHIDDTGTTVLRVKNCDEVVYIPPIPDRSNPATGDWLARLLAFLGW